ncbi:MAG: site-specific integrase [Alphaproteobacteria bacterium]|nr:site-specific integrase [Alphaproteobacteria bacterium]
MVSIIRRTSPELVRQHCADWPKPDQAAWIKTFDPETVLGVAPCWAPVTQYQNGGVYSRYLEVCRQKGLAEELSPDGLQHFIRSAENLACSAITIAGYVWALWKVATVIRDVRSGDFNWLMASAKRIEAVGRRSRKRKADRYVSVEPLLKLGFSTMRNAAPEIGRWADVQAYRDGLFLAFSSVCPERLRALEAIRLSWIADDCSCVKFPAEFQKTGEPSTRIVPAFLRPALARWINEIRPTVAGDHDLLWVAKGGRPLGFAAIQAAMRRLTQPVLGIALTPHRLRDAAATFIVEEITDQAALAARILNHRDPSSARHYTEAAEGLKASRQVGAMVEKTRIEAG